MGRNTLEDQQIELFSDIKSIDKSSGVKNCLRCGEEKPLSSYGITHRFFCYFCKPFHIRF